MRSLVSSCAWGLALGLGPLLRGQLGQPLLLLLFSLPCGLGLRDLGLHIGLGIALAALGFLLGALALLGGRVAVLLGALAGAGGRFLLASEEGVPKLLEGRALLCGGRCGLLIGLLGVCPSPPAAGAVPVVISAIINSSFCNFGINKNTP